MKKVVIVGGGPVGLYAAVQIIRKYKNTQVIVIEKRQEYSRRQILFINKKSMTRFPRRLIDRIWGPKNPGCYVDLPSMTRTAKCYVMKKALAGFYFIHIQITYMIF
ncbi:hypothetical protein EB118_13450 [bacterium]|nr:hypothetical protein [bacterium]NDC94595.1 hypothetical protein [bacterium]NDD84821.1 hypothetical protein [bacterium]NDG31058.1 hypothetical protein [bacterium]